MKPIGNKIQLEIDELKFGAVQSDAIAEKGKIIAVGDKVGDAYVTTSSNTSVVQMNYTFPIGSTIYFKAWAVDIITDTDGKKYYFIDANSDAICAIKENA